MNNTLLRIFLALNLLMATGSLLWGAAEAQNKPHCLVDTIDQNGYTPLMHAAQNNDLEAAQQLIAAKANVNHAAYDGFTPFTYAARNGHLDMVNLLLEYGANPRWLNNYGNTALRLAASTGHSPIVEKLLKTNASLDLDIPGEKTVTPLIAAIANKHIPTVKMLIDAKADIHKPDLITGKTPLEWAQKTGNKKIVKLIKEAPQNFEPKHNHYPDTPQTHGYTPLMEATTPEVTEVLLNAGAHVDTQTKNGITALMIAALSNRRPLVVQTLLAHNANIDLISGDGFTAWQMAASEGYTDVIEQFLYAGMDVNNQCNEGNNTMLMTTAEHGHEDLTRYLLAKNANPNVTTNTGDTALSIAAYFKKNEIVELLLANNALVNTVNRDGATPLHVACTYGDLDIVKLLVSHKANIHQPKLNSQMTPLLIASSNGHIDIVKFLLEHDITAQDKLISYKMALYFHNNKAAQLINPQQFAIDGPSLKKESPSIQVYLLGEQESAVNKTLTVCAECDKKLEQPLQCSRCKITNYCSDICQKAHWKVHKPNCKAPDNAQAASSANPTADADSESQKQSSSLEQPDQDTKKEPAKPLTSAELNKLKRAERAAKLRQHEADEAARLAKIYTAASQRLAQAIQKKDTRGVLDRIRQKIALLPEDEKELTSAEKEWYLALQQQSQQTQQPTSRLSSSSSAQATPQGPRHAMDYSHYDATSYSHASAAASSRSHQQSTDKKPKIKPQKKPKTKQPNTGTSHHNPPAAHTPLPTLARGSRQPAPEPLPTPDALSPELIALLNKKLEERELQREQERCEATLVQQAADTPALEPEVTPENDARAIPYSPELKAQALPERYVTVIEHPRLGILKADLNHIVTGDRDGGLHLDYQNEQERKSLLTRLQVNTFAHENNGCYSAKYTIPGTNQTRDSSLFPSTWKSKTLIEKFRQAIQDPLCHIYEEQNRSSNAQPANPDTCVIGRMFDIQNINNNPDNQQMSTIYFKAIIKKKSARDGIAILRTIYPITQEDYQQIANPHPEHKQQEQIELLQALRESRAIAESDELNRAVATSVSEFNEQLINNN